jgi:DNA repair protein RadC
MSEYLPITSWALEDRPREKLLEKGKEALSDAELIAILLGTGTRAMSAVDLAKAILQKADNDLNSLAKLSLKDLQKIKGIGQAKAITIASALELGRRRKDIEIKKKIDIINGSQIVYELMKPHLLDAQVEEFWIILLNRANNVIKKQKISQGGVSGTVADPKVIFKYALEETASGIILIHNHPSGNLKPSQEDISLTQKLKEGAKLLDMVVLDHLIFANTGYFSFVDNGEM